MISLRRKCRRVNITYDDLVVFIVNKMKDGHSLNWCCGNSPVKINPDEKKYIRHNCKEIDLIVKETERIRYDGFIKTYLRSIGAEK